MNKILLFLVILIVMLYFLFNINYEKYTETKPTNSAISIYIDNQLLKLYNIDSQANEIITELKNSSGNDIPCTSDISCKKINSESECRWIDSYKCGIVIDTSKMYEHTNYKKSYIQLFNVDSLNINFKFTFFLNSLDTQLIARSSLNLWEIYIKGVGDSGGKGEGATLVIKTKNRLNADDVNEVIIKNLKLDKHILYDMYLVIDNKSIIYELSYMVDDGGRGGELIYKTLNGSVSFYNGDDNSIYKCDQSSTKSFVCGPYPNECRKKLTNGNDEYYCIFDKNHSIIFGQPNILDNTNLKYFDGYIGRFIFDKDKLLKKECRYQVLDSIGYTREICKRACKGNTSTNNNSPCTEQICKEKCKDVKVCNFDSKINPSNHQIDCLNKCNLTNGCTSEYCNEQCNNCEDDCYWIAKNYNLDGKKDITPRMAFITLSSTSYDGTKATIRWRKPCKINEDCDILGYILFIYKTYKKNEGLDIQKIDGINCLKNCEYEVNNLINDESYTIGLRAYNPMGLGKLSNLLTFTTYKKSINMDIIEDI
jgi:hypothetical protein